MSAWWAAWKWVAILAGLLLLSLWLNVRQYGDRREAAAAARASTSTSSSSSSEPPAGANVAAALPPEIVEAAAHLNGLTWQKLKAELAKGGIDKVVIKAALDLELAKPEPEIGRSPEQSRHGVTAATF